MAFVSIPDTALVNVRGVMSGEPVEFGFHCEKAGGYTDTDIEELATELDEFMAESFLPLLEANSNYSGVNVRGCESPVDYEFTANVNAGPGENLGGSTPANLAIVLTKNTGFTGRSARGRSYLFGIPNSYRQDSRHMTDAALSAYTAFGELLRVAVITLGWNIVVVSRVTNGIVNVPPVRRVVTQFRPQNKRLDSQRGRLGKNDS